MIASRSYPLKRLFDLFVSAGVLVAASPLLLGSMLAVWLQDFHSPFYKAPRVARGGGDFVMMKVRSMVVKAAQSGVNSTGANDRSEEHTSELPSLMRNSNAVFCLN